MYRMQENISKTKIIVTQYYLRIQEKSRKKFLTLIPEVIKEKNKQNKREQKERNNDQSRNK